ncbi:hypothetical protein [Actinokineospora iranica]|uniref:Uncharacterized protein n=1 Tax=Actinokineospora iranica TaxID=1271860 RepID=A0A1G6KF40_9PSEU|nr:hypothetical protein [Actinokineospora iranica]SDC29195.1 hypothetical protein SAMN05216174_101860 [Actinokineospora iranica]
MNGTDRPDEDAGGFLVDGVAPQVIGGGPAEDESVSGDLGEVAYDREPPTSPIQAQTPPPKKGWLGKLFGRG